MHNVDWSALGLTTPFEGSQPANLPPAAFNEQFGNDQRGYLFAGVADPHTWELSSRYEWPPPLWETSSETGSTSSSASSFAGGDFPVPHWTSETPELVGGCTDGIDPLLLLSSSSSAASDSFFDSPVAPRVRRMGHRLSFGSDAGEEYNDDAGDADWLPQSPLRYSRSTLRAGEMNMQFIMEGVDGFQMAEGSQATLRGHETLKASRALRPSAPIASSSTLSDTSLATRPTKYPKTDSTPFIELITKKSRGRRPVDEHDLALDHYNGSPSDEQIAFAGKTKTGKIKKVFLCQVPGCGRCFRRSEHLVRCRLCPTLGGNSSRAQRRHIRSIHSDEKPFECPECGKGHSRSDNLTQHRRGVHGVDV